MSINRDNVDKLSLPTSKLYADAERALITNLAAGISDDVRGDNISARSWMRIHRFRAAAKAIFTDLTRNAAVTAGRAVADAAQEGAATAHADIAGLTMIRGTAPIGPRPPLGTLVRSPAALIPSLSHMHPHMTASAEQMYRHVINGVLAAQSRSEKDRLALAQRLLDKFAAQGITGFRDKAGRRWSVTHYVEMATRTATAQVAISSHLSVLADHGLDLVKVSTVANCSPQCAPFQGRLLSVSGNTRGAYDDNGDSVPVVTSVALARQMGLHHPGCRHHLTVWIPGDPLPEPVPVRPADYAATQKLRALERRVRAAKRVHAAAMTPIAATAANSKVRALQGEIRLHIADTSTPRIRRREQIGVAL